MLSMIEARSSSWKRPGRVKGTLSNVKHALHALLVIVSLSTNRFWWCLFPHATLSPLSPIFKPNPEPTRQQQALQASLRSGWKGQCRRWPFRQAVQKPNRRTDTKPAGGSVLFCRKGDYNSVQFCNRVSDASISRIRGSIRARFPVCALPAFSKEPCSTQVGHYSISFERMKSQSWYRLGPCIGTRTTSHRESSIH